MMITPGQIKNYIPQRPPFIMIDQLLNVSHDKFESWFKIEAENIFVENGRLREFALIENIAQTCSAGLALTQINTKKKPIDGFIGAISKLELFFLPSVNESIHTIACLKVKLDNMYLVKGEVFLHGKKLIECEMKLVGM